MNSRNKSQGLKKGVVPSLNLPLEKKKQSRPYPKKRTLEPEICELAKDLNDLPAKKHKVTETLIRNVPTTHLEQDMINDENILDTTRFQTEIQYLKQKVKNCQKTISRQKFQILQLKKENRKLKERNSVNIKTGEFMKSQQLLSSKLNKGRRYSSQDKSFALALYYCSTSAYKFMRKHLCLPTIRSLRRWLQNLVISPGLNENILDMLEIKSHTLTPQKKVVSVVIDEMSLKREITYNSQNDMLYGFEDYGSEFPVKSLEPEPCDQALVVMIRGLTENFKQVIGFFLSKGPIPAEVLKRIVITTINKVKNHGFIPKAVVCDQGSNNLKMRHLFGLSLEQPYIIHDEQHIYFFHDTPHLLKSLRNNFKKYTIKHENNSYLWKHIEEFFIKDSSMSPKLTKKHIELPPFTPMRVCLAAQILSHSVSRGILTYASFNYLPSAAIHTAIFIKMIDNLFDCFNSLHLKEPKIFKCPLKKSSPHWKFLDEAYEFLGQLKIENKFKKLTPCINGWRENITALKLLFSDLQTNVNIDFLMTRRLTQDCIENLFCILRAKGGNTVNPNSMQFQAALRMTMCNQILSPSKSSNCEKDFDYFLLRRKEFEQKKINITVHSSPADYINDFSVDAIESTADMIETNALAYITGYICSKLCPECKNILSTKEDPCNVETVHISMKKYDNASFLFPNECALKISESIHTVFNTSFKEILINSKVGIKKILNSKIKADTYGLCDIQVCRDIFIDKFLNVEINSFIKNFNENYTSQIKNKRNLKAKKITHE